jgi:hypothetical protein
MSLLWGVWCCCAGIITLSGGQAVTCRQRYTDRQTQAQLLYLQILGSPLCWPIRPTLYVRHDPEHRLNSLATTRIFKLTLHATTWSFKLTTQATNRSFKLNSHAMTWRICWIRTPQPEALSWIHTPQPGALSWITQATTRGFKLNSHAMTRSFADFASHNPEH